MEEALGLSDYLPVSYAVKAEEEYIAFLWTAFESNYQDGRYEFSSLAFHLLYMSFASFSIWQIRLARINDFERALIGFPNESEIKLMSADSPFKFYERLKESQIFRFLKLLGCANSEIGEFSKFVKRRNKIAHPSGTVFFNDRQAIDKEIAGMMHEVDNIQRHMIPVIADVYGGFLEASSDADTREYSDEVAEVQVNLMHRGYLSNRDLLTCCDYDITRHAGHQNFDAILRLHAAVRDLTVSMQ